jgi:hypothetical protein
MVNAIVGGTERYRKCIPYQQFDCEMALALFAHLHHGGNCPMTRLFKPAIRAITAAAIAAMVIPTTAMAAGSSGGTGGSAMTVNNVCEIKGNTVDLGTYLTSQTWGDVASQVGWWDNSTTPYTKGSRGVDYLDFGAVTCSALASYKVFFAGTGYGGYSVQIPMNGKVTQFYIAVKSLGGVSLSDGPTFAALFPGAGRIMGSADAPTGVTGTGTGAEQRIRGAVIQSRSLGYGTTTLFTDKLTKGGYTDTLSYTLTF